MEQGRRSFIILTVLTMECELDAITSYSLHNTLTYVCPHPLENKVETERSSSLPKLVALIGTLSVLSES